MFYDYIVLKSVSEENSGYHKITWLHFSLSERGEIEEAFEFSSSSNLSETNSHFKKIALTELEKPVFIYDFKEKKYFSIQKKVESSNLIRYEYNTKEQRFLDGQTYNAHTDTWMVLLHSATNVPLHKLKQHATNLISTSNISMPIELITPSLKTTHFILYLAKKLFDALEDEENALPILIQMPELVGMEELMTSFEKFCAAILVLLKKGFSAEAILDSGFLSTFLLMNSVDMGDVENAYHYLNEIQQNNTTLGQGNTELKKLLALADTTGCLGQDNSPLPGLNRTTLNGSVKKSDDEITAFININTKISFYLLPTDTTWERYAKFKNELILRLLAFKENETIYDADGIGSTIYDRGYEKWQKLKPLLAQRINKLTLEEIKALFSQTNSKDQTLPLQRLIQLLNEQNSIAIFDDMANDIQWKLLLQNPNILNELSSEKIVDLVSLMRLSVDNLSDMFNILHLSELEPLKHYQTDLYIRVAEFYSLNCNVYHINLLKLLRKSNIIQNWREQKILSWKTELLDIIHSQEAFSDKLITLRDSYENKLSQYELLGLLEPDPNDTDSVFIRSNPIPIIHLKLSNINYPTSLDKLYSLLIDELSQHESFDLRQCLNDIFAQFDLDYPSKNSDGTDHIENIKSQIIARIKAIQTCIRASNQNGFMDTLLQDYDENSIINAFVQIIRSAAHYTMQDVLHLFLEDGPDRKQQLRQLFALVYILPEASKKAICTALAESYYDNSNNPKGNEIFDILLEFDFMKDWFYEKSEKLKEYYHDTFKNTELSAEDFVNKVKIIFDQIEFFMNPNLFETPIIDIETISALTIDYLHKKNTDDNQTFIANTLKLLVKTFEKENIDEEVSTEINKTENEINIGLFFFEKSDLAPEFYLYLQQNYSLKELQTALPINFQSKEIHDIVKEISTNLSIFLSHPEVIACPEKKAEIQGHFLQDTAKYHFDSMPDIIALLMEKGASSQEIWALLVNPHYKITHNANLALTIQCSATSETQAQIVALLMQNFANDICKDLAFKMFENRLSSPLSQPREFLLDLFLLAFQNRKPFIETYSLHPRNDDYISCLSKHLQRHEVIQLYKKHNVLLKDFITHEDFKSIIDSYKKHQSFRSQFFKLSPTKSLPGTYEITKKLDIQSMNLEKNLEAEPVRKNNMG